MSSAAVSVDPARAVLPFEVAGLTEDEARALFRWYRFIDNDGQPHCPHCGHRDAWDIPSRSIFKCKKADCGRQFSLTSGTPFAYRKLKFKKLVYIIACFNHAAHAQTAHSLFADIGVQYKTAFAWLHKLRDALKQATSDTILEGEVEVDGAYFGGKNRPSNSRKRPRDTRRSAWRYKHKTVQVVVARERGGGSILTWVAKEEGYASREILSRSSESVVYFTDEGNWSVLDDHPRYPVNHTDTFCTPESCINLCENFNSFLRYAEQAHKKIGDRYLDLYAAEAAWRIQRGKKSRFEGFGSIMAAMCRRGRSGLTGYFKRANKGGSKRLCPMFIDKGGTIGWWRQPTPEEWKSMRHDYLAEGEQPPPPSRFDTASLKFARSPKWRDDFVFLTADDFARDPKAIPDRPGVYAIFLDGAEAILSATGYKHNPEAEPHWTEVGCLHSYTGESYGVRSRLKQHLFGEGGPSNLRETLFAIQWCTGALPEGPRITADRESSEAALSAWLQPRTIIAVKICSYTKEHEKAVLERVPSPLNIKGREGSQYAQVLVEMRHRFSEAVSSAWPPIKPTRRPVRR